MATHFMHRPGSGRTYTLLTSAFSHSSGWHLLVRPLPALLIGSAPAPNQLLETGDVWGAAFTLLPLLPDPLSGALSDP